MIANENTLPEHITADECTEIPVAMLTVTPAGATRWIIGTIANHDDEGILLETLEVTQRGRIGVVEDDEEWEACVIEMLADHGWKARYPGDIAYDTNIELIPA